MMGSGQPSGTAAEAMKSSAAPLLVLVSVMLGAIVLLTVGPSTVSGSAVDRLRSETAQSLPKGLPRSAVEAWLRKTGMQWNYFEYETDGKITASNGQYSGTLEPGLGQAQSADAAGQLQKNRLFLCDLTARTIGTALGLLGIQTVARI
jgi:hypothetical protein